MQGMVSGMVWVPAPRGSPRERVHRALAHQATPRAPFSWGFGPTPEMAAVLRAYLAERGIDWWRLRCITDDALPVSPRYGGPALSKGTDIWGIQRQTQSYGLGAYDEISLYPLAGVTDPAQLASYPWPDPEAYDHEGLREQIQAADPNNLRAHKLSIDTCGNVFEIYCWMTGLEEALTNLILNPALVHAALAKIAGFFERKLCLALPRCADLIDILYYADDLGSQRNLLMSRQVYRRVLQPYHARLYQAGKTLAPHATVMMHSDGAVFDILPDLIEAGLEMLEAVQVDAKGMAPEALKAAYGRQLGFHGGISVQSLLPHGDATTVYKECQRLVEVFAAGGGYIAAPTHAVQAGTPPENVLAMLRAVLGEDDFAAACDGAAMSQGASANVAVGEPIQAQDQERFSTVTS
jgi:uroporphyrinogen decarboxylase